MCLINSPFARSHLAAVGAAARPQVTPAASRRRLPGRLTLLLALASVTLLGLEPAPAAPQAKARPVLPDVQVLRDLEYVQGGHARNRLDLYLPEKAPRPLPVILWVHGGGWTRGDKTNGPAFRFATKGYAVASMNYRFSQHATFPAQIHDCKAAVRWLRANARKYGLDADHIGAWGGSAGGHLVALLGTTAGVKDLEARAATRNNPAVCRLWWTGMAPRISSRWARKTPAVTCSAATRKRTRKKPERPAR